MQEKTQPKVTITMYNDLPAGQFGLAQMWSGDIVNAQYYLPKGVGPRCCRYWFPPDGKGMVDNDLMVILARARTRCSPTCSSTTCSTRRTPSTTSATSATSRRRARSTAEPMVADGYVPANLATAVVKPEWFDEGYRLLELPPEADAAWHQVWQEFKAGA